MHRSLTCCWCWRTWPSVPAAGTPHGSVECTIVCDHAVSAIRHAFLCEVVSLVRRCVMLEPVAAVRSAGYVPAGVVHGGAHLLAAGDYVYMLQYMSAASRLCCAVARQLQCRMLRTQTLGYSPLLRCESRPCLELCGCLVRKMLHLPVAALQWMVLPKYVSVVLCTFDLPASRARGAHAHVLVG